jgi:hypothetical protein
MHFQLVIACEPNSEVVGPIAFIFGRKIGHIDWVIFIGIMGLLTFSLCEHNSYLIVGSKHSHDTMIGHDV